jgi:RHS Repeat
MLISIQSDALRRRCAGLLAILSSLAACGALAATVVYEYDDAGRLKRTVYPSSSTSVTYTLDAAGNRTEVQTVAPAVLQFAQISYSAFENAGSVAITVTRTATLDSAVSATMGFAGTATQSTDYTVPGVTL